MPELCSSLAWDSNFWGYPIARLNRCTLTEASLAEVMAWCKSERTRCLYFAADGTCPQTLALAHAAGFQFVDARIDLAIQINSPAAVPEIPGISVRRANASDLEALQHLARSAHRDSRFHKDVHFAPEKAAALYAAWIHRDLVEHAVHVCTNHVADHAPLGYVTCQRGDGLQEGRIGLLGVDAGFHGRGIGRTLVMSALQWFNDNSVSTVRVATQATNVPALRLYERTGFLTENVRIWLHKWFPSEDRR